MEVLMLLMQLALLILGILCPFEIRQAYFTHILILCLYLLATKNFKHLIFITILIVSLLFNWEGQKQDINVNAHQIYQIPIYSLENSPQFGFSLESSVLANSTEELGFESWFKWFKRDKLAVDLVFDDRFRRATALTDVNVNQSDSAIQVTIISSLPAKKNGNWMQRRLFRSGFKARVVLQAVDWTLAQKINVNALPEPLSQKIKQALDVRYSELASWPYTKALLLGATHDLDQKDYWLIKYLGLMHLFVVSGLHIGFVYLMVRVLAGSVWYLLPASLIRFFGHKAIFFIVLLFPVSILYALLTGWGESVQRAVLMLLLWRMFNLCGIKTSSYRILLCSLYLILLMDFASFTAPGLWLSFSLVFLLLVYFDSHNRHFSQTVKLQFILTLCATGLILGWQSSISSVNVLVNLMMLPLTGFLWFPVAFIASLITLFFDNTGLMVLLDSLVVSVVKLLELIAYSSPSLTLVPQVGLIYKVVLYMTCLVWVLYRHRVIAWFVFPLLLILLIFTEPFNEVAKVGSGESAFVLLNRAGDLTLYSHFDGPVLSSQWVNNRSELSMMWLTPMLYPVSLRESGIFKVMVWPIAEAAITPAVLSALSPNWLVLKRFPSKRVVSLLSAMNVSWLVLAEGEQMKFEFWRTQWLIKHSNCLIFLISSQENNCMRVAKLESVLNYSPKL